MRMTMAPRLRFSPHLLVPLALALPALGAGEARAQELPADFQMGIFEISIAELEHLTSAALVAPDGVVLIPLTVVLEQARIPFERDSAALRPQVVDAARRPVPALVDHVSRRVERGDTSTVAGATELVVVMGDVYVAPRLISLLLDADVEVDFGSLRVRIRPRTPFPAHLAAEADRRRRLAQIRMGWATDQLPDAPLRPLSGAGVLRYAVSGGTPDPIDNAVMSLEAGLALLGGEAVVGYAGSPGGDRVPGPDVTFRYQRYVPENAWLTFVRAGDVTAEAGLARSIRGLTLTNRPLRRGEIFQDLAIHPDLPPGWEIEVYRYGQLIGFTDPGAPGSVTVPITYGRTELDVRMIGPSGEVLRSNLLYSIPETQLPDGRLEYSAGGGSCLLTDCDLLFVDADYGVTRWLTLGTGYQAERDTAGVAHRPALSGLVVRPGGWIGEGRFVAGRLLTLLGAYRGAGPYTGSLGFDLRSPEVGRVTLLPQTDSRWSAHGDIGRGSRRVMARLSGLAGGSIDGWSASAMSGFRGGFASLQVEDYFARPTRFTLSAFRVLSQRWLDGRYTSTALASLQDEALATLQLGVGGVWDQRLSAGASIQWERFYGVSANLTFSRHFPVGQVQGVVSGGAAADLRASLRTDGAIAVDPFRSVEPASYSGIGFGGLDLFAFYDLNGNGVADPGEPPAADVAVQAGDRFATSDSSGHARVWGLVPYEKMAVRVASSWGDPRWTPLDSLQVIRPVPHVFNPIELPLIGTREVIARLVAAPGVRTTAGIGFTMTNLRTGHVIRGMTLSDGTMYVSQVPVGRYSLEFSDAALEVLRARVPGEPLEVLVSGDDPDEFVAELPDIVVEPRAAP